MVSAATVLGVFRILLLSTPLVPFPPSTICPHPFYLPFSTAILDTHVPSTQWCQRAPASALSCTPQSPLSQLNPVIIADPIVSSISFSPLISDCLPRIALRCILFCEPISFPYHYFSCCSTPLSHQVSWLTRLCYGISPPCPVPCI
jgi:hypothetical protein